MVTADLEGGEQEKCICHLVAAEKHAPSFKERCSVGGYLP
eukprot:Gb_27642 [translate_table: standard]